MNIVDINVNIHKYISNEKKDTLIQAIILQHGFNQI